MKKTFAAILAFAVLGAAAACHRARPNMAPRPEALKFPLREAGSLGFDGTLAGEVANRYGTAWFATEEGDVYALEIRARRVLWKFRPEAPAAAPPEPGDDLVWVRDAADAIYGLDRDGRPAFRAASADPITTAVREREGRLYFGCRTGRMTALDIRQMGRPAWESQAGSAVISGPVFSAGLVIFGTEDGRLMALDEGGRTRWTLATKGAVRVDPAASDGWLYFGTADRYFCKARCATGKQDWAFRLAGALVRPPLIEGRRLLFPASDSVVYCLSAGNGEILWWQAFPARVVHALLVSDGVVLVSGLSRELAGYDLARGFRVGDYSAAGEVASGPAWASPDLLVVENDPATGRERLAFLARDRTPVQTLGEKGPVKR